MSCRTAPPSSLFPEVSSSQRQIRSTNAFTSSPVPQEYCKGQRTKIDAPLGNYSFFVESVCAPVEENKITIPQYVYQVRKLQRISVDVFDEFMYQCKCKWISYSLPYYRHSECRGTKQVFKYVHLFITCTVSSSFGTCADVWKTATQLKPSPSP